ncbi:TrkH family potassium uptake protein [Prevotella sp. KH2C16]|uniref:TrkH family potassium uptake protein n=1 Tax=Prevotella sp. KH2C16 TaxID=1855325 RepID=UPI0008E73EC5|nr:TrkH family potassium uptake protein [Prevotella sp. KH2C16]SFG49656.1 trk system potassium uptake protein TrkH [Prevotella sp. KH2C16]
MINWKIIYKVLGSLLFIEASLLFWCLLMAFFYEEDDFLAFAISLVVTMFFGFVLRLVGRNADNNLSRKEAYLVVSLSWIVFSFFGTLPFLISGYITNFTDAYFETMSGFTTTGATIIDDVEVLPHGLLFWRSLTQWIGGLGIVFFTIALLPSMVGGSVKVFAAEATGPIKTKLHPRLSVSAKWIWLVYLVLTVACAGSYMLFGMDWFDGINYAMTTTATGGFSTHNTSTEFFNSPALEYTCVIFCFLSGVNFMLLYFSVAKLKIGRLFKNAEFQFYLLITLGFTAFIMAELITRNGYDLEHAFRSGAFQVVSFITTTGLFNDDAARWPHVTWVVLAACMFFGGCSGSTAGGFKAVRGVMLLKTVRNEFRQMLHPNAVLPMKINGTNVSQQKRVTLLAYLTTYLTLCLVISFTMIAVGIDNTNAITITLSCIGNVGPTLGLEIGPTMSWSMLPDVAKWMCAAMMLIGRLEIFTVLVIFTPQFWRKN